jgi:hypothetical protein
LSELLTKLDALCAQLAGPGPGRAQPWGGADVIITSEAPIADTAPSFYPELRPVVTSHAEELSWLFVELRDTFIDFLDAQNKIEFFGRLANAANRHLSRHSGTVSAASLCLAVLHEAYVIAEEVERTGVIDALPMAAGGTIGDDERDSTRRPTPASAEAVRAALRSLGVEL